MKKRLPLVSIIIVNWNGGEILQQCLRSLFKIDYEDYELIVVDNGSTDGSDVLPLKLKIKNEKLKIIRNKTNLGFAKANNQGVKVAKGKYILLLNNDTKVTVDFLTKLVNRMEEDRSIGAIQPKIFLMDNPGFLDNAGSFLTRIGFLQHWGIGEKDGPEFNKEREIFSAKGACMLIRKEIIDKVSLFDSAFFSYFEESDFCWRVWLGGWRVLFYPQAKIYHKLGFTIRRLNVFDLNYHYYKNRISSLIKNLEIGNLMLILIPHLAISLGLSVVFLLQANFKSSFIIIKAILWNLLNLGEILQKRRKVQKLRIINDRELFKLVLVPINWSKFLGDFRRIQEDFQRKV